MSRTFLLSNCQTPNGLKLDAGLRPQANPKGEISMNTTKITIAARLHLRPAAVSCFAAALLLVVACGGKSKQEQTGNPASDLDEAPLESNPTAGDGDGTGADENPAGTDGDGGTTEPGDGDGSGVTEPAVPEGPAVTFEIKNSFNKDLVFNLDAGWAASILVYSGKPPKAVSVLPFAKHCTASCDADNAARCPVCKEPTSIGAIRKAEKRETVAVGATFEVKWETAEVHSYEKTTAKGRKCDCHKMAPVPEGSYTVRACGLRLSKRHKTKSVFQCVILEDVLTFPADGPQTVVLDFGDPKKKK